MRTQSEISITAIISSYASGIQAVFKFLKTAEAPASSRPRPPVSPRRECPFFIFQASIKRPLVVLSSLSRMFSAEDGRPVEPAVAPHCRLSSHLPLPLCHPVSLPSSSAAHCHPRTNCSKAPYGQQYIQHTVCSLPLSQLCRPFLLPSSRLSIPPVAPSAIRRPPPPALRRSSAQASTLPRHRYSAFSPPIQFPSALHLVYPARIAHKSHSPRGQDGAGGGGGQTDHIKRVTTACARQGERAHIYLVLSH